MVGVAAFLSLIFTTTIARLTIFFVFGFFASAIYLIDSNSLIKIEQELGSNQATIPMSFKSLLKPYLIFLGILTLTIIVSLFIAYILTVSLSEN